jgi:hypothetical protein
MLLPHQISLYLRQPLTLKPVAILLLVPLLHRLLLIGPLQVQLQSL